MTCGTQAAALRTIWLGRPTAVEDHGRRRAQALLQTLGPAFPPPNNGACAPPSLLRALPPSPRALPNTPNPAPARARPALPAARARPGPRARVPHPPSRPARASLLAEECGGRGAALTLPGMRAGSAAASSSATGVCMKTPGGGR